MRRVDSAVGWDRPLPPVDPLIPLDEMIRRIDAARLEQASTICPTCASRVDLAHTRICTRCREIKSISAFVRNRGGRDGYDYECKACKRVRMRPIDAARYLRTKRDQFRAVLNGGSE